MRLRIQFLLHRRLHVRQQTTVSTVIGKVSYTHPKKMTKKRHGKCEMLSSSSDEGDEVTATHRPQLTLPSRNPGMVKRHTHAIVPIKLEQGIQNKNRYLREAISFAFIAVIIRIVTNNKEYKRNSVANDLTNDFWCSPSHWDSVHYISLFCWWENNKEKQQQRFCLY